MLTYYVHLEVRKLLFKGFKYIVVLIILMYTIMFYKYL